MTTTNNAAQAQTALTDGQIERIRIRAEKDSLRFGHTVDIPLRADLLLALLLAILYAPRAMWGWIKRRVSGKAAGENRSRWDKEER